jgi:hypothetical protein
MKPATLALFGIMWQSLGYVIFTIYFGRRRIQEEEKSRDQK